MGVRSLKLASEFSLKSMDSNSRRFVRHINGLLRMSEMYQVASEFTLLMEMDLESHSLKLEIDLRARGAWMVAKRTALRFKADIVIL